MPKLDLEAIPRTNATGYPPEFADKVRDCHYPVIDMHLSNGRGFHRKDGSGF
ncbi:hypothetical protein [Qipengyuania sp.]|uniref:hypothetical protein n=1 Tax=Qipengyuania sp. TaxID=2004515 RepID=UPI0035C7F9C7